MKESLRAQLDRMQNRLEELNAQLASEDIGKDINLLKKLNQEHAETSEVLDTYALWKQAGADLEAARQMREEPDMREFADEEIADAETRLQAAQERTRVPAAATRSRRRPATPSWRSGRAPAR